MLPRFLLTLWVPLVVVAFFAFSSERAYAEEEALASWYGPGFSGLPTASGEPYDPFGYTAAHKTMPLGTELLVSYGSSSVAVTVNDRGPYVGDRELDLSQGAAEAIGLTEVGVDYVEYTSLDQYSSPESAALVTQATDQYASTATTESELASTSQYAVYDNQYSSAAEPVIDEVAAEEFATVAPDVASDTSGLDPVYSPPVEGPSFVTSSVLVVRPGETLSEIALEMGVSTDYLAAQNRIPDQNYIYAGQVLYY